MAREREEDYFCLRSEIIGSLRAIVERKRRGNDVMGLNRSWENDCARVNDLQARELRKTRARSNFGKCLYGVPIVYFVYNMRCLKSSQRYFCRCAI